MIKIVQNDLEIVILNKIGVILNHFNTIFWAILDNLAVSWDIFGYFLCILSPFLTILCCLDEVSSYLEKLRVILDNLRLNSFNLNIKTKLRNNVNTLKALVLFLLV